MSHHNKLDDEILDLYYTYGESDYIGEDMTQLEHAVQCAELAIQENSPKEIVMAALLHDIGHLLGFEMSCTRVMMHENRILGIQAHEHIGADYLAKKWLKENANITAITCRLIRNHVNTKRFLAAQLGHDYAQNELSEASRLTLQAQGGPMNEDERREFKQTEEAIVIHGKSLFEWHLKFREWDNSAKKSAAASIAAAKERFRSIYLANVRDQPSN